MAWISVGVSFLGGIGLGSVLTAVIQRWLTRRARADDILIEGRQEAFRGIFEATETLELGWTIEKAKRLGFWIIRVELLGSRETIEATHARRDTAPNTEERRQSQKRMIKAMRRDLKLPS